MGKLEPTQLARFLDQSSEKGEPSDVTSSARAQPSDNSDYEQLCQLASAYDQLLLKEPGTAFMKSLRRWERRMGFKTPLIWSNVMFLTLIHVVTLVWVARNLWRIQIPMWQTIIFSFASYIASGWGVTGGAHRYWSHRAYKQNRLFQALTIICFSSAGMNSVFDWVRDHRVHHKFSETTADPHDAKRGFFFSHVGWLMMKKHPDVARCGKQVDMSDITSDVFLRFHRKYFTAMKLLFCFAAPMWIPVQFWGESWHNSTVANLVRYVFILNATWSVNSFAHIWGQKPYDKYINPTENRIVSFFTGGEGWHNYHHTFPWDYRAAELGGNLFNTTTLMIEWGQRFGWTYDLKIVSPKLVKSVSDNRGDHRRH